MVVLGNPPYSVSSLNRGEWIDTLLDDYKQGLHEKKLNIDDDYIKFIRFAQWRIDKTGYGILGFITNNSYLDGLTHRRMREYLLGSFSSIYIMNLHGSSRRGEQAPGNVKDENVFDIQQGVAIGLFVKEPDITGKKHVYYADKWGARENKYQELFDSGLESTGWQELTPTAPYFFFVPKDLSLEDEYSQFWSVRDSFVVSQNGLKTDRDELFFDFESKALEERISRLFSNDYGDDFKDRYRVYSSSSFDIEARRNQTAFDKKNIRRCLYRPFDERYLYYDPKLTSRPASQVMQHVLRGQNIALLMCRQQAELGFHHILCSNKLAECCAVSLKTREITSVFPLYLYPTEGEMQFKEGRHPNLNPEFTKAFSEKLELKFVEDGKGDIKETFGPEDIFNYAYAVFHSPTYRTRYAEFLKIDFPRLPLTSNRELFVALVAKGTELVSLHLMESPLLEKLYTQVKFDISGSSVVEKARYDEKAQRVYINKEQYFEGIPPEVWTFHIGGYQVCDKWLKDRQKVKRKLTIDEAQHYQKIVIAIRETARLMAEIDALIPGWPLQ
jgi:predicted helicase